MKLSLSDRLLLMVAVPLLGMLWVSGWNTVEKILLSREMGRLQGLVTVATHVGALAHEMQKERGMSAGFLGSKGANFAAELPKQREATDKQRKALADVLARFDARPPPLMLLFVGCMAVALGLAFSTVGTAFARLPLWALVAFQGFRLPLELLMHEAAGEGVMPPQMTWTGLNLDVLTGASALVVAPLLARGIGGPRLALAWNIAGSALLAVDADDALFTRSFIKN